MQCILMTVLTYINVGKIKINIVLNKRKIVQRAAMCDEISLQKTSKVSVVAADAEEISEWMMVKFVSVILIVLTTANRLHEI